MQTALPNRERLVEHPLFRSQNLDETRDLVAKVFCAHRLATADKDGQINAVHNRVDLGRIALNYLDYGSEVQITPGELNSFYLVQIPLSGEAEIRCGEESIMSNSRLASVPNPIRKLDMTWRANNPQLLVHINRSVLEEQLEKITGRSLTVPVQFDLGMDLTTPQAQSWLNLVETLCSDAENNGLSLNPGIRRQYEDLVITGLLYAHHHNYSEMLDCGAELTMPRNIRKAVQLCIDSPDLPLTLSELASSTGVSIRSLQAGFKQYTGLSPMEFLKQNRLARVHDELLNPDSDFASVAEVAFYWGFNHLGRFAAAYKARYGELPSQTLRT